MTFVYCRVEDKLPVCIKTTPSFIQKKKLKLCFCVWTHVTWPRISESTFSSKILSDKFWKTAQVSEMVCSNVSLTVHRFEHNALPPEFPDSASSLNLLETLSFLREYLIFLLWVLNDRVFDKLIQFKGCIKSDSYYFYCFNGFTDS